MDDLLQGVLPQQIAGQADGIGDAEQFVQTGPAEVRVHQQDALAVLRKHDGEVENGSRFSFARAAADHRERVGVLAFAGKQHIGAQHAIGLGMGAFRPFLKKRADVLGNDAQHRRLQRTLDVVDRLHAGVEVLNEKRQSNADDQADNDP